MKIASLTLDGVLGAPDGTYDFRAGARAPRPVVHLHGAGPLGKTSILRAIAALKEHAGAYGAPPRPSSLLKRGRSGGQMAATWWLSPEEQAHAGLDGPEQRTEVILDDAAVQPLVPEGLRAMFARVDRAPGVGGLELIPAMRPLVAGAVQAGGPMDDARRARDDERKYEGLAAWLVERSRADGAAALRAIGERGVLGAWDRPDSLSSVRSGVAAVVPDLRLEEVEVTASGYDVLFARRAGGVVSLGELSSSERDAVTLVLVAHRHRLERSLVLIDEPAPHGARSTRRDRLRAFTRLAEEMQVIATSSSPDLCSAVDDQLDIELTGGA